MRTKAILIGIQKLTSFPDEHGRAIYTLFRAYQNAEDDFVFVALPPIAKANTLTPN